MSKIIKSPGKSAKHKGREAVHSSSGNVYADLKLSNAAQQMAKAELANQVCRLIANAGMSQAEAAVTLGIDQPKVSALVRGRLSEFSTERLMRFITALDQDVIITIRNPPNHTHARVRVLVEA